MLTADKITAAFQSLGLSTGDILVLQSSYKGCGGFEGGPVGLINALMELLGSSGTLIMPAYNFTSWTEHHYFDALETASENGAITEAFRNIQGVGRTKHPIHSLSVFGKLKNELMAMDHTNSFGPDSVFAKLIEVNALYATVGLGEKMPFLPCHFAEAELNVGYRKTKDFGGLYLNESRTLTNKVYSFDVRINAKAPVYDGHIKLINDGKVSQDIIDGVEYCSARARRYHQDFSEYIRQFPEEFSA